MSGRFVNFKLAKMLRIKLALTLMNQSVIGAGIPWHCGNDIWNHQRGLPAVDPPGLIPMVLLLKLRPRARGGGPLPLELPCTGVRMTQPAPPPLEPAHLKGHRGITRSYLAISECGHQILAFHLILSFQKVSQPDTQGAFLFVLPGILVGLGPHFPGQPDGNATVPSPEPPGVELAVSRAAGRCTTAAEESCTTGTMRKD